MLKKSFFHSKQKIQLSKFIISKFSDLDIKKFDIHEFIKNGNFVYMDLLKDIMGIVLDVMDETFLLFKIRTNHNSKVHYEYNYGIGFCSNKQKTGMGIKIKINKKDTTYLNYLNFGKSFSSVDGEYRAVFISMYNIKHLKTHFNTIWTYHNILCKKLIKQYGWKIRCETTQGSHWNSSSKFTKEIEIDVLTLVIVECIYLITQRHQFISINDDYLSIFINEEIRKVYRQFFIILMETVDSTEYYRFIRYCFLFVNNEFQLPLNKFGIKIVPLTYSEKLNLFDTEFKSWKELMLNKKMSKLLLNFVSPSVSLHNVFFFVKLSDSLFSNRKQIEKINNNDFFIQLHDELEHTMEVLKSKKELVHKIYKDCVRINMIQKKGIKSRREIRIIEQKCSHNKLILKYVISLEKILSKPIELLFNNIILSDYCLCLINKNTGNTLINVIKKSLRNEEFRKRVGFYVEIKTFNKYLFEIIYGLACFHLKMGYVHTDLHYSNITMNCISVRNWNFECLPKKKYICYKFLKTYFLFENTNYYSTIIDMSRCVSKDEKKMLIKFILTYLPEYIEYKSILEFISKQEGKNYIFYICCYLDILLFLERLYVLFEILKLNSRIKKKINDMITSTNNVIKKNMTYLIENYKLKKQNFYETFFQTFFGSHAKPKKDIEDHSLCGFYDFNNELQFNVNRLPSNIIKFIDTTILKRYIKNRNDNIKTIKKILNLQ